MCDIMEVDTTEFKVYMFHVVLCTIYRHTLSLHKMGRFDAHIVQVIEHPCKIGSIKLSSRDITIIWVFSVTDYLDVGYAIIFLIFNQQRSNMSFGHHRTQTS